MQIRIAFQGALLGLWFCFFAASFCYSNGETIEVTGEQAAAKAFSELQRAEAAEVNEEERSKLLEEERTRLLQHKPFFKKPPPPKISPPKPFFKPLPPPAPVYKIPERTRLLAPAAPVYKIPERTRLVHIPERTRLLAPAAPVYKIPERTRLLAPAPAYKIPESTRLTRLPLPHKPFFKKPLPPTVP